MNDKAKKMSETLMKKIRSGEVTMKPRMHFVLQALLAIVGVLFLIASLVYIGSLTAFVLNQNSILELSKFGFLGIMPLLRALPWMLIVLGGVVFILIEVLARSFSFTHRQPVLYTTLGVLGIAFFGSLFLSQSSFHSQARERSLGERSPYEGMFYRHYENSLPENVFRGSILEVGSSSLSVRLVSGEETVVYIVPATKTPPFLTIESGEDILFIGKSIDGGIEAEAIRPLLRVGGMRHAPNEMRNGNFQQKSEINI